MIFPRGQTSKYAREAAEFSAKAEKLYDELAARGEKVVAELLGIKPSKPAAKKPASKPAEQPQPLPEEKGRVHDIGIYVDHSHRDAATPDH